MYADEVRILGTEVCYPGRRCVPQQRSCCIGQGVNIGIDVAPAKKIVLAKQLLCQQSKFQYGSCCVNKEDIVGAEVATLTKKNAPIQKYCTDKEECSSTGIATPAKELVSVQICCTGKGNSVGGKSSCVTAQLQTRC